MAADYRNILDQSTTRRCERNKSIFISDLYMGALVGSLTVVAITTLIISASSNVGFMRVVETLGVIAIAASAYFAYGLLRATELRSIKQAERAESNSMMTEAINTLERSYSMFTSRLTEEQAPIPDRLLWLSVARMLLRFDDFKERVTEPDHRIIIEEQEQYWRHEFYVALDRSRETLTEQYFRSYEGQHDEGASIEPLSILTIYEFSRWPEEYPDPISRVDMNNLIDSGVIPVNHRGARQYIDSLR